jgi:Domain of unknown function (DUF4384)
MNESMKRSRKSFGILLLVASFIAAGIQRVPQVHAQRDTQRDIISDDFLKSRRKAKSSGVPKTSGAYRLATKPTKQFDRSRLQIGITIWRLEPVTAGSAADSRVVYEMDRNRLQWIPKRVEADAQFREGDSLRLSIESPRAGYLYVVNRDWLADGSYGETNLIFPTEGEDNRLEAGKLIDIPGQGEPPFKATPKANQSGELLTFIVTSSPLSLRLSQAPLPISKAQLTEWEQKWSADGDRFEMNGGAGRPRTAAEQLAASRNGTRQLTREDPLPQTVYSLVPKSRNALLFNVVLSYVR